MQLIYLIDIILLLVLLASCYAISFNSPILNQLWEQGEAKLTEQEKVFLHLQLTSLDEIQTELKYSIDNKEQNKVNRLSVDLRRGIESLISQYNLEMPRSGLRDTSSDWNNVEFASYKLQLLWQSARDMSFSDEQLTHLHRELSHHQQSQDRLKDIFRNMPESDKNDMEKGRQTREEVLDIYSHEQNIKDYITQEALTLTDRFNSVDMTRLREEASRLGFSEQELSSLHYELDQFEDVLKRHNEAESSYRNIQTSNAEANNREYNNDAGVLNQLNDLIVNNIKQMSSIHNNLKMKFNRDEL